MLVWSDVLRLSRARRACITTLAVVAAALIDAASAVHASEQKFFAYGNHPVDVLTALFVSTPLLILLQIASLVYLLRQVVFLGGRHIPGERPAGRWLMLPGVVVAPIVMLVFSAFFVRVYQEQYGHWFFHINDGYAGLALLPVSLFGSLVITRGIFKPAWRRGSRLHFAVAITLAAVCAWYTFSTGVLDMLTDGLIDLRFTAFIPAVAAANYGLLAIDGRRHGNLEVPQGIAVRAWFAALAVSVLAKIPFAMKFFASLPVEAPAGYGDCFVVSAAAKGHAGFVRSRYDPARGRNVNDQLLVLQQFEARLAADHPVFHRRLRWLYNRLGPRIAAGVRSPFVADLVYLLLKPVEWLARIYIATR